MKTPFKLLLCVAIIFYAQNIFADDDYDIYAQKVREEVWAWDRPEFKNYTVPDQYKNESAVIIAMHNQLQATGKNRFRIKFTLAMKINKELLYTNTLRMMVKINDKVALDKYSEISYKEEAESTGSMITSKFKTIVGARIIKPDGTIKEVNVNEAVVVTKDKKDKKDKEDYKKLAISDLQVGDILDYFIQKEGHADTENIPPLNFVFAEEYPMLSYSIHCEIGEKLTTEYRCINDAPDFTVSTNENKDVILDVQKTNIPKVEGMERWISPYRELPMIRMAVLNNGSKEIWKPQSARKSGLHKDVPSATIFKDAESHIGSSYYHYYFGTEQIIGKTHKAIKEFKKSNPKHTKEELADFIYDATQYFIYTESPYYLWPSRFINTLNVLLKYHKVEYKAGMVTSKYGARKNEVANMDDVSYLTLANNNKQIFTFDPIFAIAGEVNYNFEGETATILANTNKDRTKTEFTIPVSDENQNLSVTTMNVNFSPDDMLLLNIDRSTNNKGSLKGSFQRRFSTREKYEEEMRRRLGIKESVLEEMQKKKSSRKYIDDYNEFTEKQRKDQIDEFKSEIKDYHDIEAKDVANQSVIHLGITKEHPDFKCNVQYSIEGLVKKAGNNYILDAGKLIGSQVEVKDEARKRNVDIYMTTARAYEHEIKVTIPDGYTVENIASLNKNVDNVAGLFTTSASLDGQTLIIKTRKVYKHAFEPLGNWGKLLEMIDEANEFYSQSVILKKK